MFKVNLDMVKEMTEKERFDAEITFLSLAFDYENEQMISGSRAMSRSPEKIICSYPSRVELNLKSSYKLMIGISKQVFARTGRHLIGFVKDEEKTAENALSAWRSIGWEIDRLRKAERSSKPKN